MASLAAEQPKSTFGLSYRTAWRWHFYAGLLCIPFVLWLSVTGTVFLFKPQIERFLDKPFDHLTIAQRATANAHVQAALAAVPGALLDSYELPHSPASATQILVDRGPQQFRVYIHPQTLAVLKVQNEDQRLENVIFRLHGELMLGNWGSYLVELAASWAVVMILTGLFLWWPRTAKGLGGVLYPRVNLGGRAFWKDMHSVVGIYVSFFALFLLFTGLPWAKSWGGYLKAIRHFSAGHAVAQDWTTSSAEAIAARTARTHASMDGASGRDMNAAHDGSGMRAMEGVGVSSMNMPASGASGHAEHGQHHGSLLSGAGAFAALDTMVATVTPLHLAEPVLISPPMHPGGRWNAKSDTRDRPLRVDLILDGRTGAILKRTDFQSKPWLDRVIGTGIAAHEGQLFGVANQIVSLLTVLGLVTLSLSGLTMWWKRKPEGVLGAPAAFERPRFSVLLIGLIVVLGLYFPFLGGSILVVYLLDKFVFPKAPGLGRWLGLQAAAS
jgi:uncharacterized iron-regulated membrane protein